MTQMFWVGVVLTSMCSWLLAIAVMASMVLDRQLTSIEKGMALVSSIVFAVVISLVLWKRVRRKEDCDDESGE